MYVLCFYHIRYQAHFWDKEKKHYNEKTVNGSTTTTVITRETGLRPLTETTFEVRVCSCTPRCEDCSHDLWQLAWYRYVY